MSEKLSDKLGRVISTERLYLRHSGSEPNQEPGYDIHVKSSGEHVGRIETYRLSSSTSDIMVRYSIDELHRGKCYAPEALAAMTAIFLVEGVSPMLDIDSCNISSTKAAIKAGYKHSGNIYGNLQLYKPNVESEPTLL